MTDSYFIKPGYKPNLVQATLDQNANVEYWNDERLASSRSFQHDVYRMAVAQASETANAKVLDVGSGPPVKLSSMLTGTSASVHLVDQKNTYSIAKKLMPQAKFTPANLELIDIELGLQFDVVICADVIEHVINPDPCLNFIKRHMSASGLLYISTPDRDLLRGPQCMDSPHPMHVREWNQPEFRLFLESRGLEVVQQLLLPQERTSALKLLAGKALRLLSAPPNWYSCQLAICRLAHNQVQ